MCAERLAISLHTLIAELPRSVGGARDRASRREGVVLRIEDEEGRVGLGEASPLPGFSVETLDEARAALASGRPPSAPSARFAHETALADLRAQREGVSLAVHLAGNDAASLRPVRVQALIDQLEGAQDETLRVIAAGASALKIKIGRPGLEAAERAALIEIARVAASTSNSVLLRADANGLLPSDSTLPSLLAELGFELLEDPFDLATLRARAPLPVRVALDETASRDPEGALAAIDEGRAHALVLKPALVGGLDATRALATAGRARGAKIIVSHLLEGPIALAASAHLALAIGAEEVHGLAPWIGLHRFVCDDHALRPPSFITHAGIALPQASGLGVALR